VVSCDDLEQAKG